MTAAPGTWTAGAAVSCAGTRLCVSTAHAALEYSTESDSETEAETRNAADSDSESAADREPRRHGVMVAGWRTQNKAV